MSASCRLPIALLMIAVLLPGAAQAKSLFEKDHPQVAEATEAYGRGDYEAALQLYEAAKESFEVIPAELHFNIGDTLVRLGRHEEAKQAYERALGAADGEFKADSFYNLGNAFLGLDEKDGAKAAYRQALKVNPAHEPARRNLELLLRGKPPEENQQCDNPSDGGEQPDAGEEDASEPQDGGDPDAGQEESEDGGESDASQEDAGEEEDGDGGENDGDGGQSDASSQDGGEEEQSDGGQSGDAGDESADGGQSDQDAGSQGKDGGEEDAGSDQSQSDEADGGSQDAGEDQADASVEEESRDAGTMDAGTPSQSAPQEVSTEPEQIERQAAEDLLDALRRNEKQFLMYQQKGKGKSRVDPEKDW